MDNAIEGRWDLTVGEGAHAFPSWVELQGNTGQFVGQVGSARPIPTVTLDGDSVRWQLPPQYEGRKDDLVFEGRLVGDVLEGTTTDNNGETLKWTGKRAPALDHAVSQWGEPIELIGRDLSGWKPRTPDWESHWSIVNGVLTNAKTGSDLVTEATFADFKLTAEYRYPKGSNSGIYLRGRYEFQILDDFETAPHAGGSGAIYGFLVPGENAIRPAEQWNVAEITLQGRKIDVVLNGVKIIDHAEIPGITGGALDSDEGAPGPLFVQGDHGPVEFRRLTLIPAVG